MELAEVARRDGKVELLTTTREFVVPGRSYPNGAHFAEVEVETDTGRTEVVKYTVVDDFGYLINPMLAEGQVHGGVAQGIGQAITEEVDVLRRGPAPLRLVHGLRDAARLRRAEHGLPCRARALDGERDRHEGLRRGRYGRRARRRHQRRARRGLGRGRAPCRHAADRRSGSGAGCRRRKPARRRSETPSGGPDSGPVRRAREPVPPVFLRTHVTGACPVSSCGRNQ